jgi:hypothetical protein
MFHRCEGHDQAIPIVAVQFWRIIVPLSVVARRARRCVRYKQERGALAHIKVLCVDGTAGVYPHAEASGGSGAVLQIVRKTACGAETTLAELPQSASQRWASTEESP